MATPLENAMTKVVGPTTSANVSAPVPVTPDQAALNTKANYDAIAAINAQTQSLLSSIQSPASAAAAPATAAPSPLRPRQQQRLDRYAQRRGLSPEAARTAYDARLAGRAAGGTKSAAATNPGANYEYWGQEWNDPIAQQVWKEQWLHNAPGSDKGIARDVALAESYKGLPGTVFNSNLNPLNWGGGHIYNSPALRQAYIDAGGQAYNAYDYHAATDPASVGMPYNQATGEALGRVNAGVIEYPNKATGTWSTTKPANWAY